MALYKLNKNPMTGEIESIYKNLDNPPHSCIPLDKANTDYQEYLEWVSKGNTPEEAD